MLLSQDQVREVNVVDNVILSPSQAFLIFSLITIVLRPPVESG